MIHTAPLCPKEYWTGEMNFNHTAPPCPKDLWTKETNFDVHPISTGGTERL